MSDRPQNKHLKQFSSTYQVDPARKRRPKTKTILKNICKDWNGVEGLVEKNILEFLQDRNKKMRFEATKHLSKFVKAEKRDDTLNIKGDMTLIINGIEKV